MTSQPGMPESFDPEQLRQMQDMFRAMGGMAPPAAGYGGSAPAPATSMPSIDPAMLNALQAQLQLQMLQHFQQGFQQPGQMPPAMAFPGMPYVPPAAPQEPTVRVSVEGMKFQYQLTEDDIHKVFCRYGQVKQVTVDDSASSSLVTFAKLQDAQAAVNDLDGKVLNGLDGTLRITWVQQPAGAAAPPYPAMPFGGVGFPQVPAVSPWPGIAPDTSAQDASLQGPGQSNESKMAHAKGSRKFTCRFIIGIENDKEFHVARRLIGQKGAHMKHIVGKTDAKLRLRGVGSGYLEGTAQKESTEPLQLCVSCTSTEVYQSVVRQARELVEQVHEDYRDFCRQRGQPVPELKVNFSENQLEYSSARPGSSSGGPGGGVAEVAGGAPGASGAGASSKRGGGGRRGGGGGQRGGGARGAPAGDADRGAPGPNAPPVDQIETLINERNEARRSSNFAEADRIRDLLQSRGVTLMDEPGGRGKGAEVTTWRYWRD